ncbi:LLM class flavin-dependent oxidoreductase [Dermatobacter hominis]|uniref:LLM class flavin-dependent oxidoreductase n=1 Tax=Dermatobacter hominis TaxID=2884263 RepID=UPI001D11D9AC|nr:LLM class flavin-dependent oxidoreductase [Dermatobacter hominis]UDY36611.1 LLM class flavin-dependent oxidoreductase [Dermatobacter hominis]
MRFDLRAPGATAEQRAELHRTAIEMARFGDEHGCSSIVLSEHHCSDDGYLPSPITLAAAVAAVTESVPIVVGATLLPLHEPARLAEDLITLDHISRGRAMTVLGLGYRPEEYELHGVDYADRAKVADRKLEHLLELLRGADGSGAPPRVTPAPFSSPIPTLAWGGRSRAAARRAGRNGIGFFAQTDAPGLQEAYVSAAEAAGHEPGLCILPSPDTPFIVFVDDDVDRGWDEVGAALLVDAESYRSWSDAAGTTEGTASLSAATTVDDLRAAEASHRVVTKEGARRIVAEHGILGLHPLCGGLDPEVGWRYLRNAVDALGA